jgi:hypothetical protein
LRAVGFLRRQREREEQMLMNSRAEKERMREKEGVMGFRFPAMKGAVGGSGAAIHGKRGDDDHDEGVVDVDDDDDDEEEAAEEQDDDDEDDDDDESTRRSDRRLSRILLARMNTLELGFAEILKEMREANDHSKRERQRVDRTALLGRREDDEGKGKGKDIRAEERKDEKV